MAVKRPIYITEKGYSQEIDAAIDTIEINKLQITAGGDIKVGAADGYGVFPVVISDDGYAAFANGAFYVNPDGSVVSAAGALQVGADGALTVGTGAETASIDADGYMVLSAIETTATDGYAILTEGGKFYVRASDGYVKIAGFAQLEGGMSLGSNMSIAGDLSVAGAADFNGGVTANSIKLDGDVAQRLYIVDADGYMKDEAKLVFNGSKLSVDADGYFAGALEVTGAADLNAALDVAGQVDLAASGIATSVRGSLAVAEAADLNGALDVAGQVDLAASGVATSVRGTLSVAEVADFNAGLLSSGVKIDGDTAQRLYIVGDDGYLKDESKLVFNGSKLSVDGDGYFSGNLQVAGTSSFQGLVDFNGGFTVSNIKIDGDVAQRLYIVDADGYIKDEEKLTFDGSKLSVTGNVELSGDLKVAGNDIKSSTDAVALTLSGADVAVAGDLTVTGNDIKSSSATALTLSGADVAVAGDLKVAGNDIKSSTDAVAITLSGADVAVAGDLTVTGNDIKSSSATAISLSGADVNVKGNLTVDGNIVADANENKAIFAAVASGSTVTIASTGAEVALPSAKVADLTATRLVLAGTAGALEDSANLTFASNTLTVTGDAEITGTFDVSGTFNVDGDTMSLTGTDFSIDSTGSFALDCVGDFNAGILSSGVKIDGDVAQRLYIVGADGYMKDESSLVFDGSKLSVTGNVELSGDLKVAGNDIKSSTDAIAITLSGADVAVAGDLTVTGNDIKSSSATALTLSGADVAVAGDLKVAGNDIKSSTDAVALTLSGADVIVAGDLKVAGNDIKSGADVVAMTLSNADVNVKGNLTVDGNIVADANENKAIFAAVGAGSTVTIASAGAEVALPSAKVADLTSGRIVLAGTAGALEDSANLTFSAGLLSVVGDGYFSGALEVNGVADLLGGLNVSGEVSVGAGVEAIILDGSTGDGYFAGALEVLGQVDLAAAGVATNVHGSLNVSEVADFNAGILSSGVAIDGDVAQRLYIVGADGYLKDESKMVFDGSKLSVDADGYFSGALEVAGAVSLHDDMSFVANKSISFAANSGAVLGLANLDGYSDGYAATNKNYVDMMVAAAGLDAGNTSSSSLLAAESISIGDPIFIDSNGKAARGDTTSSLNEKAWVFGVAAAAAASDASVEVVRDGIASGVLAGLGMSAGAKVWLAAGGGLTATKPAAGRLILMGFALSSSDLLVDVRDYGSFVA